jgi:hypothetical protein
VIVQDCLTNTGLAQWVGKTGFWLNEGKLEIKFETENYSTKQKVVSILRYSNDAPEKGLIVSSKTFPIK